MPDALDPQDPREEARPDYTLPEYVPERAALGLGDEAAAADILGSIWDVQHNKRVDAWVRRQANDNGEEGPRGNRAPGPNAEGAADGIRRRQDDEDGGHDNENQAVGSKTVIDLPKFNPDSGPPSELELQADPYALDLLRRKKFTPLWWFTDEGLKWAQRHHTDSDDSLVLSRDDGGLTLRARARPTAKEVPDGQLDWGQTEVAMTRLVLAMARVGYPHEHCKAFGDLLMGLVTYAERTKEAGSAAAIEYLYRVRKMWHNGIVTGEIFNVAKINHTLFQQIREDIVVSRSKERLNG